MKIPQRTKVFTPPMSDEKFVERQLVVCDKLSAAPVEDAKVLEAMALSPARPLEVMPRQESTSTIVLKPEEIKALLADFPDCDFQRGAGGDTNLIYLEHVALRNRLSEVVGLGQWRFEVIKSWNEDFTAGNPPKPAVRIYIEGRLIIRGVQFGCAIGDGNYFKNNAKGNYGDAFESAKTACLRRCCKDFGIGLQAYSKDWCEAWKKSYPNFERPNRK